MQILLCSALVWLAIPNAQAQTPLLTTPIVGLPTTNLVPSLFARLHMGIGRRTKHRATTRIQAKLVYAYTSSKKYVDPALRKDIPTLGMYDFNCYKMLKKIKQQIAYKQDLQITVSRRYRIKLQPQSYSKKEHKISIRAIFLRRNPKKKHYKRYATTLFRLQDNGKVALMGPTYKYGRALLILRASHQP